MPDEYWSTSFNNHSALNPEAARELTASFRRYTIVFAVDGKIVPGGLTFVDPDKLASIVTIEDGSGTRYKSIDLAALDPLFRDVLKESRALLARTMGELGEGLAVLAFPGADAHGKPIAQASGSGTFFVNLNDVRVRYQLPLGSVLPPQFDPRTGEQFPGNYQFNPFTGVRLTPRK
jgi:hypothetical protein